MSMIIWNIRGLGSRNSWNYLKFLIDTHQPIVLGIVEPKQQISKIGKIARKLGFSGFCHGNPTNTHIWFLQKSMVCFLVIDNTSQTLSLQLILTLNVHNPSELKCRKIFLGIEIQIHLGWWEVISTRY